MSPGVFILGGICPRVSVQGVSVQGVHVQEGYVLEVPCTSFYKHCNNVVLVYGAISSEYVNSTFIILMPFIIYIFENVVALINKSNKEM